MLAHLLLNARRGKALAESAGRGSSLKSTAPSLLRSHEHLIEADTHPDRQLEVVTELGSREGGRRYVVLVPDPT